jgi:hypothetical protein
LGVMTLFPSSSEAAPAPLRADGDSTGAISAVVDSSTGARGNTFKQEKQKQSLEPILQVQASLKALLVALETAQKTASSSTTIKWSDMQAAVASLSPKIPTTEAEFKALFDAYSDPLSYQQRYVNNNAFLVYYTKGYDGPGRPSIESSLPTRQPLQFGARNEAWIAWSDFIAEFDYYKDQENVASTSTDTMSIGDDLIPPLRRAVEAVTTYLAVSGVGEAS